MQQNVCIQWHWTHTYGHVYIFNMGQWVLCEECTRTRVDILRTWYLWMICEPMFTSECIALSPTMSPLNCTCCGIDILSTETNVANKVKHSKYSRSCCWHYIQNLFSSNANLPYVAGENLHQNLWLAYSPCEFFSVLVTINRHFLIYRHNLEYKWLIFRDQT